MVSIDLGGNRYAGKWALNIARVDFLCACACLYVRAHYNCIEFLVYVVDAIDMRLCNLGGAELF